MHLEHLTLGLVALGDEGTRSAAEMLNSNTTLRVSHRSILLNNSAIVMNTRENFASNGYVFYLDGNSS